MSGTTALLETLAVNAGRNMNENYDGNGALGLGDSEDRGDSYDEMGDNLPAVSLGTNLNATAIACGGEHSCALLSNAQIKCWGECHAPPFPLRYPG